MTMKKETVKTVLIVILALLLLCSLVQNIVIEENQTDIDKRLTKIEQDNSDRDKTQIDLYQRLNESMYDQIWIRRDIRILQNIVGE